MQRFLNKLLPFLFIGIAMVAFAFGIMLLAYLFLFGALVGSILFAIGWIRSVFSPKKTPTNIRTRKGRTIDSNDWKKME